MADAAAGLGSCCNRCDSATAKGCGGFYLQGKVLHTGDFLQESSDPPLGNLLFPGISCGYFGHVCGDFWFPSTAIFITYGCEICSIRHNLTLPVGVSWDWMYAITASCTCSPFGLYLQHFTVWSWSIWGLQTTVPLLNMLSHHKYLIRCCSISGEIQKRNNPHFLTGKSPLH